MNKTVPAYELLWIYWALLLKLVAIANKLLLSNENVTKFVCIKKVNEKQIRQILFYKIVKILA